MCKLIAIIKLYLLLLFINSFLNIKSIKMSSLTFLN